MVTPPKVLPYSADTMNIAFNFAREDIVPYKVLTVDDSRTIRMIVVKALKAYNCQLFEAENGVEGLALASSEKPDLIILDITMPVMTGIEMLGKLAADSELKEIPVIMLTAESGKDNVMQIVKLGVKDYIVKPFRGDQLIERVKNILDLKPALDQMADPADDKGGNFFAVEGNSVILNLPGKITRALGGRVETALKEKIAQMNKAGARKLIINLAQISGIDMTAIQLIIMVFNLCTRAKIAVSLAATAKQQQALQGFRETSVIQTFPSVEEAKAAA